jgi:hypothetical protein
LTLELWMQNFVDRAASSTGVSADAVIGTSMNQESRQAAIA